MASEDVDGSMCETRLPDWHRKAWVDLTFAIVPAGTAYPR